LKNIFFLLLTVIQLYSSSQSILDQSSLVFDIDKYEAVEKIRNKEDKFLFLPYRDVLNIDNSSCKISDAMKLHVLNQYTELRALNFDRKDIQIGAFSKDEVCNLNLILKFADFELVLTDDALTILEKYTNDYKLEAITKNNNIFKLFYLNGNLVP